MNNGVKVVMNWSSGKDAALAYHLLTRQEEYAIEYLLTTLSAEHERVFMHGVREKLLDLQAERMKKELLKVKLPASPDDSIYRNAMLDTLTGLKVKGVAIAAYGDIFLDDLRAYREEQLQQVEMSALFPLWKKDTTDLVHLVEQSGIEALIVCVSEKHLGKEFLGRKIDSSLLADLPPGVDPCGENGEFHTFVYNAPFFSEPIAVKTGEIVYRSYAKTADTTWDTGFYFVDVLA